MAIINGGFLDTPYVWLSNRIVVMSRVKSASKFFSMTEQLACLRVLISQILFPPRLIS